MEIMRTVSQQSTAGWLLILSGMIFLPAGILYAGRAIWKWPAAQSPGFVIWERGLVMAANLGSALGFVLLERLLDAAGDNTLAPIGMTAFLAATVLILAAESFSLHFKAYIYPPVVVFVVLAFLGQALFGLSILATGLLPGWVGVASVIWNLAWLVILPITRPQDVYYPWLHYVAPLIIGTAILTWM